jgi:hypothetical protein
MPVTRARPRRRRPPAVTGRGFPPEGVVNFHPGPSASRIAIPNRHRHSSMLWACLLLPSLPLDVFARAAAPDDAQHPFVVASGGHYPRVVAANAARARQASAATS